MTPHEIAVVEKYEAAMKVACDKVADWAKANGPFPEPTAQEYCDYVNRLFNAVGKEDDDKIFKPNQ